MIISADMQFVDLYIYFGFVDDKKRKNFVAKNEKFSSLDNLWSCFTFTLNESFERIPA